MKLAIIALALALPAAALAGEAGPDWSAVQHRSSVAWRASEGLVGLTAASWTIGLITDSYALDQTAGYLSLTAAPALALSSMRWRRSLRAQGAEVSGLGGTMAWVLWGGGLLNMASHWSQSPEISDWDQVILMGSMTFGLIQGLVDLHAESRLVPRAVVQAEGPRLVVSPALSRDYAGVGATLRF